MSRKRLALSCLVCISFLVVLTEACADNDGGRLVIPPGREAAAQALLQDLGSSSVFEDGLHFRSIRLEDDRIRYELSRPGEKTPAGTLILSPVREAEPEDRRSESFAVRITVRDGDPRVAAILDAAADSVVAHDTGGFYVEQPPPSSGDGDPEGGTPLWVHSGDGGTEGGPPLWVYLVIGGVVSILAWKRAWVRDLSVGFQVRLNHAIPSAIQIVVLVYWALYHDFIAEHFAVVAIHLVYAILLDMCVSFATRGRWVVGLAPFPVVLSTNLYVQFGMGDLHLGLAVITLALLSKTFVRRDGRHIFNPSALGLAVVGAVNTLLPELGGGDNSQEFTTVPNMVEVLFLLGLIVQLRIPVVLVSVAATVTLIGLDSLQDVTVFPPWNAAVFLVLVLLITDPATLPRTPVGRVLFGFAVGIGMACFDGITEYMSTDFWAKVMPVPIVNWFVPHFDRWGAWIRERIWTGWLEPRFNRAHVAAWIVLVVAMLYQAKPEHAKHHAPIRETMPFVQLDDEGRASCEVNPVYCEPFSFVGEAKLWLSALRDRDS